MRAPCPTKSSCCGAHSGIVAAPRAARTGAPGGRTGDCEGLSSPLARRIPAAPHSPLRRVDYGSVQSSLATRGSRWRHRTSPARWLAILWCAAPVILSLPSSVSQNPVCAALVILSISRSMKQRRARWWETSAATKAHTSTYRLDVGEPGARHGDRSSREDRRRVADGRIPAWSMETISKVFSASSPSGSVVRARPSPPWVGNRSRTRPMLVFFSNPYFPLGNNIGYVI
jgi:hypothetical protein